MTPDLLHFEARPLPRTPKVWLFDMDDTLYCASAGMFDAIHYEMRHWIAKALSIPVPEAQAKQEAYWAQYGATFIGLARHEGIDAEAFLNAVHHFDVEALARLKKFAVRHGLPHINPHAFRHTMASMLYFNGVDSVSISKRLGHAQVSTTANIYAHVMEAADQQNAEILSEIFLKKA